MAAIVLYYFSRLCLITFTIIPVSTFPIDSVETVDPNQSRTILFDSFDEMMEQTKELGQLISNTASSVRTTMSDFAAELFGQGMQQTSGFFSSGPDLLVNNYLHEAKRFGKKGISVIENAASATETFVIDNLFKFPFIEMITIDERL